MVDNMAKAKKEATEEKVVEAEVVEEKTEESAE